MEHKHTDRRFNTSMFNVLDDRNVNLIFGTVICHFFKLFFGPYFDTDENGQGYPFTSGPNHLP